MIGNGDAVVRNNVFLGEQADDDAGSLYVLDAVAEVWNNTFVDSHAGDTAGAARIYGTLAVVDWTNNLVTGSTAAGSPQVAVLMDGGAVVTGETNLYFGNQGSDVDPAPFATDLTGLDPLLTGVTASCETTSVLPDAASPAIDAGSLAVDDPDGSRSDIGATGGPDALRDRDGDGVFDGLTADRDCDDDDPLVFPGAPELCNGRDDDCDGLIDVGASDETPWYEDSDGDTWGDVATETFACDAPGPTWVDTPGDCDDSTPAASPDGLEICSGADEDCDGLIDLDDPDIDTTTILDRFVDADGDGFGTDPIQTCDPTGTAVQDGDCGPDDPTVFPDAPEVCNGIDDDCDEVVDEDCSEPTTPTTEPSDRQSPVVPAPSGRAGCGCAGTPTPSGWASLLLLACIVRRRFTERTKC
jgi:MYXO-CTERM domain-containing protein